MKKRGLGKGLDALLGGAPAAAGKAADGARHVPADALMPGRFQPRRHFAAAELKSLAESVRANGVLQPLLVRPAAGGRFEIIAGERRWRAAKLAGLRAVPAVVRAAGDDEARLLALIENLQRDDLNPMEQAKGIAALIADLNLTHAQAGAKVGLSRPAVSNLLRLLDLAAAAQTLLENGALEMGHARALLPLPKSQQEVLAKRAAREGWTVRDIERQVRALQSPAKAPPRADADTRRLEEALSRQLGARVHIRHRAGGGGKLTLHYPSLDALDEVLRRLRRK